MITQEYRGGPYVVQCNECLDTEEIGEHGSNVEAINAARNAGYKPVKVDDEWQHLCKECA